MHWTCAELTRRVSHTPESDDQAERWQRRSLLPLRTYSEYDWQAVRLVALQNQAFITVLRTASLMLFRSISFFAVQYCALH